MPDAPPATVLAPDAAAAPVAAYVRSAILPAQKPPVSQRGVLHWLRENLFSNWLNTCLTLAALYVVYGLASFVGPWLWRSVWYASSLSECREIVAATWGEGKNGACFAIVRERWLQIIFGFYPREAYWRPTLTLGLMLLALAPILFARVPRQLMWFSLAFPAVAFWLLWGGTVWFAVGVLAGLALTGAVWILVSDRRGLLIGALAGLAAFLCLFLDPVSILLTAIEALAGLFSADPVRLRIGAFGGDIRDLFPLLPHFVGAMQHILPFGLPELGSDQFGGFLLSTVIGVSGIAFSLPIGVLLALGRQSDLLVVRSFCVAFIEGFRGVPLITLLFVASLLLNYFLPPGTEFDVILRVIIMVTMFSAAYMAEVIRGGLAALPRGQYEAADALGLNYWQAQRLIIMPQALKVAIPGIVGNFIGLFKDTTLVSLISLQDPLALVSSIRANTEWNGLYWEPFMFVAALFFLFCFSMSRYSLYLEKTLKTDHR